MQHGKRTDPEMFISDALALRGWCLKSGLCFRCNEIYYTLSGTSGFCSNNCANFKHGNNGSGYKRITVNGKRVYEHRHVAKAERGVIVHHINGDKQDNRPENLEIMTQSEHCSEHQDKMKEAQYGTRA